MYFWKGVMTMLVEIVKGSDEVKPVRDKNTGEVRGFIQEAYFHMDGSAFPVKGKIRVENGQGHVPGKYNISPSYRVGRFGDLEINPFDVPALTPAKPDQVKAVG